MEKKTKLFLNTNLTFEIKHHNCRLNMQCLIQFVLFYKIKL